MKKIYSSFLKAMAAVMAMIAVSSTAMAQNENEPGAGNQPLPIELGQTVTCTKQNVGQRYLFHSTETGILLIESTSWSNNVGINWATVLFTASGQAIQPASTNRPNPKGWTYVYRVEENTDYIFRPNATPITPLDNVDYTLKMDTSKDILPEIAILSSTPGPSNYYDFADSPELQIIFNLFGEVKMGDTYLTYMNNSGERVTQSIQGPAPQVGDDLHNRWDLDVFGPITKLKGEIQTYTPFSIEIKNVTLDGQKLTGPYTDNGNIVLDYIYGDLTLCTSYTFPGKPGTNTKFMSYWPEDTPLENAMIQFVFDNDLLPQSQQNIMFSINEGPYKDGTVGDSGEDAWPQLPGAPLKIEGNTLTVDLRGVQRLFKYEYSAEEQVVGFRIHNLKDKSNQPIFLQTGEGVFTAINFFNLPYEALDSIALPYDLDPAYGSLAATKEMMLYMDAKAFKHVRVDGFTFSQEGETIATVEMDNVTTEDDPAYTMYYIPVPIEVQMAEGDIDFAAMLYSLDGFDYSLGASFYNEEGGYVPDPDDPEDPDDPNDPDDPSDNPGSGVDAIGADNGAVEIYTIEGILVKGTLEELPAGLYIVNGVKVLK